MTAEAKLLEKLKELRSRPVFTQFELSDSSDEFTISSDSSIADPTKKTPEPERPPREKLNIEDLLPTRRSFYQRYIQTLKKDYPACSSTPVPDKIKFRTNIPEVSPITKQIRGSKKEVQIKQKNVKSTCTNKDVNQLLDDMDKNRQDVYKESCKETFTKDKNNVQDVVNNYEECSRKNNMQPEKKFEIRRSKAFSDENQENEVAVCVSTNTTPQSPIFLTPIVPSARRKTVATNTSAGLNNTVPIRKSTAAKTPFTIDTGTSPKTKDAASSPDPILSNSKRKQTLKINHIESTTTPVVDSPSVSPKSENVAPPLEPINFPEPEPLLLRSQRKINDTKSKESSQKPTNTSTSLRSSRQPPSKLNHIELTEVSSNTSNTVKSPEPKRSLSKDSPKINNTESTTVINTVRSPNIEVVASSEEPVNIQNVMKSSRSQSKKKNCSSDINIVELPKSEPVASRIRNKQKPKINDNELAALIDTVIPSTTTNATPFQEAENIQKTKDATSSPDLILSSSKRKQTLKINHIESTTTPVVDSPSVSPKSENVAPPLEPINFPEPEPLFSRSQSKINDTKSKESSQKPTNISTSLRSSRQPPSKLNHIELTEVSSNTSNTVKSPEPKRSLSKDSPKINNTESTTVINTVRSPNIEVVASSEEPVNIQNVMKSTRSQLKKKNCSSDINIVESPKSEPVASRIRNKQKSKINYNELATVIDTVIPSTTTNATPFQEAENIPKSLRSRSKQSPSRMKNVKSTIVASNNNDTVKSHEPELTSSQNKSKKKSKINYIEQNKSKNVAPAYSPKLLRSRNRQIKSNKNNIELTSVASNTTDTAKFQGLKQISLTNRTIQKSSAFNKIIVPPENKDATPSQPISESLKAAGSELCPKICVVLLEHHLPVMSSTIDGIIPLESQTGDPLLFSNECRNSGHDLSPNLRDANELSRIQKLETSKTKNISLHKSPSKSTAKIKRGQKRGTTKSKSKTKQIVTNKNKADENKAITELKSTENPAVELKGITKDVKSLRRSETETLIDNKNYVSTTVDIDKQNQCMELRNKNRKTSKKKLKSVWSKEELETLQYFNDFASLKSSESSKNRNKRNSRQPQRNSANTATSNKRPTRKRNVIGHHHVENTKTESKDSGKPNLRNYKERNSQTEIYEAITESLQTTSNLAQTNKGSAKNTKHKKNKHLTNNKSIQSTSALVHFTEIDINENEAVPSKDLVKAKSNNKKTKNLESEIQTTLVTEILQTTANPSKRKSIQLNSTDVKNSKNPKSEHVTHNEPSHSTSDVVCTPELDIEICDAVGLIRSNNDSGVLRKHDVDERKSATKKNSMGLKSSSLLDIHFHSVLKGKGAITRSKSSISSEVRSFIREELIFSKKLTYSIDGIVSTFDYITNHECSMQSTRNSSVSVGTNYEYDGGFFGLMEIKAGGTKNWSVCKNYALSFIVLSGQADIQVHTKCYKIETYCRFFVPKGAAYRIQNLSDTQILKLEFFKSSSDFKPKTNNGHQSISTG